MLFQLIKASLWGTRIYGEIDVSVYEEMKKHAISALPANVLPLLNLDENLLVEWKTNILQQISFNTQCKYLQSILPISVPYVILKGTSAAQYYPYPELRTMGDIDIITKREDYNTACEELLSNGYHEMKAADAKGNDRHRTFAYGSVMVELHQYFAMLNDPQKAESFDDLIISNITSTHVLPDLINGLVLLEHISQHLEEGLGLRQIIDWMMFINKCISDSGWQPFYNYAKLVGLEKLAIITTRLCELYFGLSEREWTKGADEELCEQLMDYVMSCGNFGIKKRQESASDISQNVLSRIHAPKYFFSLLRERGMMNWKAVEKHKYLERFSWIYQIFRYIKRGSSREKAFSNLISEYKVAMKKNAMFNALGVKRKEKGVVIYKKGKYVKESGKSIY